ncbi:MAG: GIY-YIG nuclease family protein [Flavobacteriales bacterium]|nr:GIY-YIG nuclease family protein [Flavobacteriales bacterium]
MLFYVYILQSNVDGRFYIGQTGNVVKRLYDHNNGKSTYTSKFLPWNLVWFICVESRSEAYILEQKIKKFKSRIKTIQFITENPCVPGSENLQISNLLDFRESS